MNLIIIGPSGSGKGTQAKKIAKKYKLAHFSSGQLIRDHIKKKTALGKKAEKYIKAGNWVPTEILLKILFPELKDKFILDGTPRYLKQCGLLDKYLEKNHQKIDAVIYLFITTKELFRRRKFYGDKFQDASRTDNSDELFRKRLQSGKRTMSPIIKYYRKQGKLVKIDGNRPIKPIFKDICTALSSLS